MNPSIIDVAKAAGVSKSTVSRVLTGGSVSEKAKKAVYRAMEELNYSPNQMAQVLRGAKSKVAGVVFPSSEFSLLRPYIATRLAGVYNTLSKAGYSVMLINPQEADAADAFRIMENHQIDGLIFMGTRENAAWEKLILSHHNVVYTGERFDPDQGFRIYMGNYNYSRDLYNYLLSNGHRKILTVIDAIYAVQIARRRQDACRDAYRTFQEDFSQAAFLQLFETERNREAQLEQIHRYVADEGCTAIFADSTEFANEIVIYLAQKGLALREDFSIVALERGVAPGLRDTVITSVCLPDFLYGVECARLLLEVMEEESMVRKDVIIPYTLEIRSSVKNISEKK